jgi:hypothetical protein
LYAPQKTEEANNKRKRGEGIIFKAKGEEEVVEHKKR